MLQNYIGNKKLINTNERKKIRKMCTHILTEYVRGLESILQSNNYLFKGSNKYLHNRLAKVFYVNATNILNNRINQIQNW